jgi:hypothetical protein
MTERTMTALLRGHGGRVLVASLLALTAGCRGTPTAHPDATALTRATALDAGVTPSPPPGEPMGPVVVATEPSLPEEEDEAPPDAGPSQEARLSLRVLPVDAEILWGAKRLGVAARGEPFEFARPKDSGPVDLVIRAPGFVPYHTRLFTDRDDKVTIELVRPTAGPGLVSWKGKPPTPPPKPARGAKPAR